MQEPLIAVTGASGHLGRLVVEDLLRQNFPATNIVAVVRDPQKVADLAARGVQVRRADYAQPETLDAAFAGVEHLLLISSSEMNQRLVQHKNVVKAARNAEVQFLAYTSILNADNSTMQLAADHKATEQIIRESGIVFAFLRNSWYTENYTDQLAQVLQHGAVLGCAGAGRVSAAPRADYATAAAFVLRAGNRVSKVCELGGDHSFTLSELASEISKQSGRQVIYRDLPVEEYAQVLVGAGLPELLARGLADADLGLKRDEQLTDSSDLSRLIERPTTTLADAVASALKSNNAVRQAIGSPSAT